MENPQILGLWDCLWGMADGVMVHTEKSFSPFYSQDDIVIHHNVSRNMASGHTHFKSTNHVL